MGEVSRILHPKTSLRCGSTERLTGSMFACGGRLHIYLSSEAEQTLLKYIKTLLKN